VKRIPASAWALAALTLAVVIAAWCYGGVGPALAALLASLGVSGLASRDRTQRPDLPQEIERVDLEADNDVEDAIAAAARGISEAVTHADDVRAGSGPGVDADDDFMCDDLGGSAWAPPVDPRAPTR